MQRKFGCLLRPMAWKWNGPILKEVNKEVSKQMIYLALEWKMNHSILQPQGQYGANYPLKCSLLEQLQEVNKE